MHFGKMVGAAVALLLYTLPVAAADTLQTIRDRGRILVAIDISHPPYGMLDDKAQETGSDVETAKLLAKDLGVKLEIVPVSGANRVPFLLVLVQEGRHRNRVVFDHRRTKKGHQLLKAIRRHSGCDCRPSL